MVALKKPSFLTSAIQAQCMAVINTGISNNRGSARIGTSLWKVLMANSSLGHAEKVIVYDYYALIYFLPRLNAF